MNRSSTPLRLTLLKFECLTYRIRDVSLSGVEGFVFSFQYFICFFKLILHFLTSNHSQPDLSGNPFLLAERVEANKKDWERKAD